MNTTKKRSTTKKKKVSTTKNTIPKNVANKKLYSSVRAMVKRRVKVWPSAYASGQVVQEYKRRGGKYVKTQKNKFGEEFVYDFKDYTPSLMNCLSVFYDKPVNRFGMRKRKVSVKKTKKKNSNY